MKSHFTRRHGWLSLVSFLILAIMVAPVAIFAITASASTAGDASSLSLAMFGVLCGPMILRDAAGDDGSEGGGGGAVSVQEALAKIEDRTLTISERFSIATSALKGVDPTGKIAGLNDQIASLTTERDQARQSLSDSQASITDLTKQLDARAADIQALETQIAALEKTNAELVAKEQDLDTRAESKMKERLGALGIESNKLPDTDPKAGETDDKKEAEAKIRELSGEKRVSAALYFKTHGKLPEWMNN